MRLKEHSCTLHQQGIGASIMDLQIEKPKPH